MLCGSFRDQKKQGNVSRTNRFFHIQLATVESHDWVRRPIKVSQSDTAGQRTRGHVGEEEAPVRRRHGHVCAAVQDDLTVVYHVCLG